MRFIISIEASHQRGMGHLFRGINLGRALGDAGHHICFVVNRDYRSLAILQASGFANEVIDSYANAGWEGEIIREQAPDWWINDRLDTDAGHARAVIATGVRLATFDDHGGGASLALHDFLAMDLSPAEIRPNGRYGSEYIILNPATDEYRRMRRHRAACESILVSMGGSDTHGVTHEVVKALAALNPAIAIHVVTGPNFRHHDELANTVREAGIHPIIHCQVPDLIGMMADADIVVCGGGVTLFEAAALGVPALTVANEPHEVPVVKWFARQGFSINAGFHRDDFSGALGQGAARLLADHDARLRMGERGMSLVDTGGTGRIISLLEASS
jgi:spore coat polysaccharide biosynthesis predicted glycosyltransferase SpsG